MTQPAYYQNSTMAQPRVKTQDVQGAGWRLIWDQGSFYSPLKPRGKWETSVYKQTTLVKVQVVLFYLYNL